MKGPIRLCWPPGLTCSWYTMAVVIFAKRSPFGLVIFHRVERRRLPLRFTTMCACACAHFAVHLAVGSAPPHGPTHGRIQSTRGNTRKGCRVRFGEARRRAFACSLVCVMASECGLTAVSTIVRPSRRGLKFPRLARGNLLTRVICVSGATSKCSNCVYRMHNVSDPCALETGKKGWGGATSTCQN